jgi:hypothetical protein
MRPIDTPDSLSGPNDCSGVVGLEQQGRIEDAAGQAECREGQGGFRCPLAADQPDAVDGCGAQRHWIDTQYSGTLDGIDA